MTEDANAVASELAQRTALGEVDLAVIRAGLQMLAEGPSARITHVMRATRREAYRLSEAAGHALSVLDAAAARAGGGKGGA